MVHYQASTKHHSHVKAGVGATCGQHSTSEADWFELAQKCMAHHLRRAGQWGLNGLQLVLWSTTLREHLSTSHFLVRGAAHAPDRGSTFTGLSTRVITDRPRNTPNAGTPRSSATGPRKWLDSRHAHKKTNSIHITRSVRRLAVILGRSSDENLLGTRCQAHHVGYSSGLTMRLGWIS